MFDSHYFTFIRMKFHFIIKWPKVKNIFVCKKPLLARRTRPKTGQAKPAGQARHAKPKIGYLVYQEYLYPLVNVTYPLRFLSTAKFSCHQNTVLCAMCVSVQMPSCKSFMNRTKSKGPKMDPWGTPDRTGFAEDLTPFNTTRCLCSQR